MRLFHNVVVLTLLSSTGVVAISAPALGQAAPAEEAVGLNEIVVTAQKRGENLQQTPIAISAITSEQVELQGISEVRDVSALAPNVSILQGTTNATAAVVTIRGIPTAADETQGFDSPIGLYLDGVYLARSSAASFEVADIERVEVLRGPQGTLFGRNTTGGAINFITKQPSEEASLALKFTYGNYDQFNARAIVNSGTVFDIARISFALLHKQRNGVVDNLLEPRDRLDPGGNRTTGVRTAIALDVADNVTITNIFDYTRIAGVPHANQLVAVGNGTFRPNVTFGSGQVAQVQPFNVAGYLANATALEPGCGKPVQRARLDTICLEGADVSIDKLFGNLFRIEAETDAVTIRSSTAYRGWRNAIRGSDLDGLGTVRGPAFSAATLFNGFPEGLLAFAGVPAAARPIVAALPVPTTTAPLFQATNSRRQNQFSQEVELVSNKKGKFSWVLGGFYFRETGSERNVQNFGAIVDLAQVFMGPNFSAVPPIPGNTMTVGQILTPGIPAGTRFRNNPVPNTVLAYRARGESYAIYAQGTYRPDGPDGALGITLGLRYTRDKKDFIRTQNGVTPFTTAADIDLNTRSKNFGKPTGNLTVDYRASDDINLYARIARGSRSGGFNARQTTNSNAASGPIIPLIPFNEESIWSYEIGAKTEFFDRLRLNASLFYNQYSDLQSTIPIPGGATFGTQVVNAGKTDYSGFELEGRFEATKNFSIDGSVGYVHKDVKQFPGVTTTGATINIASVIRPGISPDWTANLAGNLTVPVGSARLTGRLAWNYVSSQVFFANPLTAPFNDAIKSNARSLFDGQLRIDGIKFGESGSEVGVTLFGRNLTNKKYIARGIDFGQLGFGSAIYADPRTYGVTLDVKF